jgi:hypothetical protein
MKYNKYLNRIVYIKLYYLNNYLIFLMSLNLFVKPEFDIEELIKTKVEY